MALEPKCYLLKVLCFFEGIIFYCCALDKPLRRVTYRSSPVYLMRNSDKVLQPRNGKTSIVNSSEANPFDPTSNQILAKYLVSLFTVYIFYR